jgi:predicted nucleic acid-binding protein
VIGIDTNVLIALSIAEHQFHEAANAILRAEAARGQIFALRPDIVSEFIHVATDPRRVEKPLTMPQALADARYWWTAIQVRQVSPTFDSVALFFDWMNRYQLGRKRILDTMLAATLYTAGVRRLFTSNPDDFRVFDAFELLVP